MWAHRHSYATPRITPTQVPWLDDPGDAHDMCILAWVHVKPLRPRHSLTLMRWPRWYLLHVPALPLVLDHHHGWHSLADEKLHVPRQEPMENVAWVLPGPPMSLGILACSNNEQELAAQQHVKTCRCAFVVSSWESVDHWGPTVCLIQLWNMKYRMDG